MKRVFKELDYDFLEERKAIIGDEDQWVSIIKISKDKCKEYGYSYEKIMAKIDNFLSSKGVTILDEGIYYAESDVGFKYIGCSLTGLPYDTDWFLKVVDEWWTYGGEISDDELCNSLETYYEIRRRNANMYV